MFENSFLLLLVSAEQTEELSPQYLIKQLIGLKKMPIDWTNLDVTIRKLTFESQKAALGIWIGNNSKALWNKRLWNDADKPKVC